MKSIFSHCSEYRGSHARTGSRFCQAETEQQALRAMLELESQACPRPFREEGIRSKGLWEGNSSHQGLNFRGPSKARWVHRHQEQAPWRRGEPEWLSSPDGMREAHKVGKAPTCAHIHYPGPHRLKSRCPSLQQPHR